MRIVGIVELIFAGPVGLSIYSIRMDYIIRKIDLKK